MLARFAVVALVACSVAGCAGKVDYVRPTANMVPGSNSKLVDKPRDAVWSSAVPELGKQFFVINNIDKASGLVNVSYSGDPEKYIDCGRITSFVKNARGERTYDFPGAKANQSYEIMDPGNGLFFVERRMLLEGRVNLVFEEIGPSQTRVTANTRYIVQRQRAVRNAVNGVPQTLNDSLSFNAGGSGAFSAGVDGRTSECVATGNLEREILSAIR